MAGYPYDAFYETRVAGSTVVKVGWGDATDSSVNGIFGGTRTVRGLTISNVDATVTNPSALKIQLSGAQTTWTLVAQYDDALTGKAQRRLYMRAGRLAAGSSELVSTINASWNSGTSKWTADDAGVPSFARQLVCSGSAAEALYTQTAGHAPWDDFGGATPWVELVAFTGGTGVYVWDGDVTSNAGNVIALAGNVTAGKHYLATGSAPTAAVGAAAAGGSINGTSGNDVRGLVSVHSGANAAGIIATVTLAGDYATKPVVRICPAKTGIPAGDDGTNSAVLDWYVGDVTIGMAGHTTFTICCVSTTLIAGNDYGFAYEVIG